MSVCGVGVSLPMNCGDRCKVTGKWSELRCNFGVALKLHWAGGRYVDFINCTYSTLIGEKSGASPSLLHTTLETNGVSECKMDVKCTWIPTWHQMQNVSWSFGTLSKTTSWKIGLT